MEAFPYNDDPIFRRTMVKIISISGYVAALVRCAAAHMMLESPVPYGRSTLNNSPLEASGLDFPCKLRAGVYEVTTMNNWKAGQAESVRFRGSAVHGGGSCQFSITTDQQPNKSSRWKVVHSVVGGCPAAADGNLLGGADAEVADSFQVRLPPQIPDGQYTFAWTWFNRKGDREMYMNCAPISVSGGGGDAAFLDTLPDMFVANLPSADCTTPPNLDFAFPFPGSSVLSAKDVSLGTLRGSGCSSAGEDARGGDSTQGGQQTTQDQDHGTVVATKDQVGSNVGSHLAALVTSTVQAEMSVQGFASSHLPAAEAASMSAAAPYDLQTDLVLHATGASVAHPYACNRCSHEGSIVCTDSDHFGICDRGCAVSQRLAPGTYCSNGIILRNRAL